MGYFFELTDILGEQLPEFKERQLPRSDPGRSAWINGVGDRNGDQDHRGLQDHLRGQESSHCKTWLHQRKLFPNHHD